MLMNANAGTTYLNDCGLDKNRQGQQVSPTMQSYGLESYTGYANHGAQGLLIMSFRWRLELAAMQERGPPLSPSAGLGCFDG